MMLVIFSLGQSTWEVPVDALVLKIGSYDLLLNLLHAFLYHQWLYCLES